MRARASALSSSVSSIGLPGAAGRVLTVGTPAALVSASGGALMGSALDKHRGNDNMFAMRSALGDAKRRLAKQRERMREHGILSP